MADDNTNTILNEFERELDAASAANNASAPSALSWENVSPQLANAPYVPVDPWHGQTLPQTQIYTGEDQWSNFNRQHVAPDNTSQLTSQAQAQQPTQPHSFQREFKQLQDMMQNLQLMMQQAQQPQQPFANSAPSVKPAAYAVPASSGMDAGLLGQHHTSQRYLLNSLTSS